MSRRRATRPLMKYSLCPLRYKRRLTTTSPGFVTIDGFSVFLFFFPQEPESAGAAGGSAWASAGGRSLDSDGAGGSEGSVSAGGLAVSSVFPGPASLASVVGEP